MTQTFTAGRCTTSWTVLTDTDLTCTFGAVTVSTTLPPTVRVERYHWSRYH